MTSPRTMKTTERIQGQGGPGRGGPFGGPMIGQKSLAFGTSAKRLVRRLRPQMPRVIAVIVFAVFSVALSAIGPKVLGEATDVIFAGVVGSRLPEGMTKAEAIEAARLQGQDGVADLLSGVDVVPGQGIDFDALGSILLVVLALYAGSALLGFFQGYVLNDVVQRTIYRMRSDVEDKLNRLPLSYFDRQPRGELLSRVTNDIDNISQTLQQTMSQLLTSLLTVIFVVGMMFYISWALAFVALVTIPISMFLAGWVMQRSQKQFITQWRRTGTLNGQIEEAFTGHSLVKVFGRQREVQAAFETENEELYKASFSAQFLSGLIMPIMMFVGNLNYVVIAVLGGLRVATGTMSLGDVQAFIQYSRQFTQPVTQIASMVNLLQSGVASAERVFELLDVDEERPDEELAETIGDPTGRVAFDNVYFRYDEDRPLIEDLSLQRRTGADGRHRRSDRRRQDDAGQLDHAVLRPRLRSDHARRTRHLTDAPRRPAVGDRDGPPGHLAVPGHHPGEHLVRPAGCDRGRDARGGEGDVRRSVRPQPPRWVRHDDRRRGQQRECRGEAADHDRPRLPRRPGIAHTR